MTVSLTYPSLWSITARTVKDAVRLYFNPLLALLRRKEVAELTKAAGRGVVVRLYPKAAELLKDERVGSALIDFLIALERSPLIEGRNIILEDKKGRRRVELTNIGDDICIGYDFKVSNSKLEILVWAIEPKTWFWSLATKMTLGTQRLIALADLVFHKG